MKEEEKDASIFLIDGYSHTVFLHWKGNFVCKWEVIGMLKDDGEKSEEESSKERDGEKTKRN